MANKKFSEFTLKTDSANVDFVVGYDGTDNVRIAPDNLGGGGASDLNGLSDVSVDLTNDSAYFVNIPSGLSGATGNLIIGENAGNALTSQDNMIAIGSNALSANNNALAENAIFIGKDAGKNMTANVSNSTVIGTYAAENSSDLSNGAVILGYRALRYGGATFSVYIGNNAAANNTDQWGYSSVGIGNCVLLNSVTNSSVVIGQNAQNNGNANKTVVLGYEGARNVSSDGHVSVGWRAGYSQTSGASNTNVGYEAGKNNTTGSYNTNLGYQALKTNTASNNTAVGYQAGTAITTGSNNIVIGYQAAASAVDVSNEITLGDANIATLRCQVQTISALSDSRDKTNVQPSTYGLDLITQLQPVTFDWNMRDGAKVGQKDLGFIAQELQEVDDENLQLVYDNNPDRLEASYGRLIPVLVQAIKELKAEVELLKA